MKFQFKRQKFLLKTKLLQHNKFMDELCAALTLTLGLMGIFNPSFFYKSELLNPEQIARNKRIFKRGGIVLVILGVALVAIILFWK